MRIDVAQRVLCFNYVHWCDHYMLFEGFLLLFSRSNDAAELLEQVKSSLNIACNTKLKT
jgi:hypothetical protein